MATALFALLESMARLSGYAPAIEPYYEAVWVRDPEMGWVCKPNQGFRCLSTTGWVCGSTDETGFRPSGTGAEGADREVICLGDSTTFCAGVDDQATWPEVLAARLSQSLGRPHRALNRAVEGYSGLQILRALRRQRSRPTSGTVAAIIYHFCLNDPKESLFDHEGMPRLVRRGDALREELGRTTSHRAETWRRRVRRAIESHLALSAWLRWRRMDSSAAALCQGAREGQLVTADFARYFLDSVDAREAMRYVLAGLVDESRALGAPLFVSVHPSATERLPCAGLAEAGAAEEAAIDQANATLLVMAREAGAQVLDCRSVLVPLRLQDRPVSAQDWHLGRLANEELGKCLATKLLATHASRE